MKAEEYYEEIKEFVKHPHFTKLTSTGIDPDYKSIFEFAEAYHDAATKANEDETSDEKCTLHGVNGCAEDEDGYFKCPKCGNQQLYSKTDDHARCNECRSLLNWIDYESESA